MADVKIAINEVPKNHRNRNLYLRIFFHNLFISMFAITFLVFLFYTGEMIINGKVKHPESLAMVKFGAAFATNWNLVSAFYQPVLGQSAPLGPFKYYVSRFFTIIYVSVKMCVKIFT